MTGPDQSTGHGGGGLSLSTTTGLMVAAVIAFFLLFVVLFFVYLRAKHCWGVIPVSVGSRLAVAASAPALARRGLDAASIAALPFVLFPVGDLKEGLECAVCLCVLSEGDAARLLPKCGHAFHLECIDMWFCSHSTCPLCRSSVGLEIPRIAISGAELVPGNARPVESSPDLGASLQLCVSQDQANNGGTAGSLEASSSTTSASSPRTSGDVPVIETPTRARDGFQTPSSPLPVSWHDDEEVRSTSTPTLRSLRKLLVLGSRKAGASRSPRGCDIEQGCPPVLKTPTTS
ncbi:hypothetical protein Cni_G09791 [Canna indica]|uniref:RING-type domain-containing protein n=1 Tax=Canna indica TaxID=4628 RepID=A0AAQ3Q9P2_9LILI|nr:hypothetical protein Cni_G09791 [Canna indica]